MKTIVIIRKRDTHYVCDVEGMTGGSLTGVEAGRTSAEAAATASRMMARYGRHNPSGAVLLAPDDVKELVPVELREIAGIKG